MAGSATDECEYELFMSSQRIFMIWRVYVSQEKSDRTKVLKSGFCLKFLWSKRIIAKFEVALTAITIGE
jgi:hypothetical protein